MCSFTFCFWGSLQRINFKCLVEFIRTRCSFHKYCYFFTILFLCVRLFGLKYLCTMYVPGAHVDQKRTLIPLELELQVIMSCHVNARTKT